MSSCKANSSNTRRVEKIMKAVWNILSAIQARESPESSLTQSNLAFQELDFDIDPNILDLCNNLAGKIKPRGSETSGSEYATATSADSFQQVSTNSRIPEDETSDEMYKTRKFLVLPQSRTKTFIVLPQSPGPEENTLHGEAPDSSCTGVLILNQRKSGKDKTHKNARVLVMNNNTSEATASIGGQDERKAKNLPKQKYKNEETAENLLKQDYKKRSNQNDVKQRKQQARIKPYRIFTIEVLPTMNMNTMSRRCTKGTEYVCNMRENMPNAARSENNKVETMTTLRAVKNDAEIKDNQVEEDTSDNVRFEDTKKVEDIKEVSECIQVVQTIKEENIQKDKVVKKEAVTNIIKKHLEEKKSLKYCSKERKHFEDRSQTKKIDSINKARLDVTDGAERLKTRKPSFHPVLRKQMSTSRQPSCTKYPSAPVELLQENESQRANEHYTLLRTRAAELKKRISSKRRMEKSKSGQCTNLPNSTEKINSDQQVTNGINKNENMANNEKKKKIFKRGKTREIKRIFKSKLRR